MNLIITISILCFVSLAACIPATGYESAKDEASETEVKRKASQLLAVNRQADERLPEHFADTQKILNALKISRDTRGSPKCKGEYEHCYYDCCPPLRCEDQGPDADAWCVDRSGLWYSSIMQRSWETLPPRHRADCCPRLPCRGTIHNVICVWSVLDHKAPISFLLLMVLIRFRVSGRSAKRFFLLFTSWYFYICICQVLFRGLLRSFSFAQWSVVSMRQPFGRTLERVFKRVPTRCNLQYWCTFGGGALKFDWNCCFSIRLKFWENIC